MNPKRFHSPIFWVSKCKQSFSIDMRLLHYKSCLLSEPGAFHQPLLSCCLLWQWVSFGMFFYLFTLSYKNRTLSHEYNCLLLLQSTIKVGKLKNKREIQNIRSSNIKIKGGVQILFSYYFLFFYYSLIFYDLQNDAFHSTLLNSLLQLVLQRFFSVCALETSANNLAWTVLSVKSITPTVFAASLTLVLFVNILVLICVPKFQL